MYTSKLKIKTSSVNVWRSLCWWLGLSYCPVTTSITSPTVLYISPISSKNWNLALLLGCTLCLGVHLQLSPVNLAQKKNFLRPGGARTPPGYAYAGLITVPVVSWEGAPPPKGPTNCQFLPCCFDIWTLRKRSQTTACDKPKPSRRCNTHGWARTADRPGASWKLQHTHAVDDLTWPACRWTCTTVFATKNALKHFILYWFYWQ